MRILHLADLHLGWQPTFPPGKTEERAGERNSLLGRAVDFALNKRYGINAVVIAGDLFETHRPSPILLEEVLRQLDRLVRNGIFVLTVPGNHDEISYHDSVYRREAHRWPGVLVQNPTLEEVARFELDGKINAFFSLAYTAGLTKTLPPQGGFPRGDADRHIGVLHGSLDWGTSDRSLPISSTAIAASGYDLLALGHIHYHQVKTHGKTKVVYAGASEAKSFSDPGTGNFTVVTLGGDPAVSTYPAGCRPCLTAEVDISLCRSQEEVIEAVKGLSDTQAMLRAILKGETAFRVDTARIEAQCLEFFYFLQVESDSVFVDWELLNNLAQEPTIRGYFVKNLLARLADAGDETAKETIQRALVRGLAALQGGDT